MPSSSEEEKDVSVNTSEKMDSDESAEMEDFESFESQDEDMDDEEIQDIVQAKHKILL